MINDLLDWLSRPGVAGLVILFVLFPLFILIVLYIYTGKGRKGRLESYRDIPFLDDEDEARNASETNIDQVKENESTRKE